jgi:hypothetical protein
LKHAFLCAIDGCDLLDHLGIVVREGNVVVAPIWNFRFLAFLEVAVSVLAF